MVKRYVQGISQSLYMLLLFYLMRIVNYREIFCERNLLLRFSLTITLPEKKTKYLWIKKYTRLISLVEFHESEGKYKVEERRRCIGRFTILELDGRKRRRGDQRGKRERASQLVMSRGYRKLTGI